MISLILQKDVNVSLAVYDFLGKELVTVDKGFQNRGEKRWKVDVSALGRGIYLFEMKLGDETFVKKIAVE